MYVYQYMVSVLVVQNYTLSKLILMGLTSHRMRCIIYRSRQKIPGISTNLFAKFVIFKQLFLLYIITNVM